MKILVINPLFEMIPELLEEMTNNNLDYDIICYKNSEIKFFKEKNIKIFNLKKELKKVQNQKTLKLKKEIVHYTKEFNKILYGNSYDKIVENTADKFYNFLKKISAINKYDAFLLVNGSFLFEKISMDFARSNNIKTIIFEYGYFRPYTITMDWKGVNINNSVPRTKEFYLNLKIDDRNIKETDFIKSEKKIIIYKKPFFEIFKENLLGNGYTTDYKIFFYNLNKIYNRIKNRKIYYEASRSFDLPEKYIFVSFQLEADSQIILNSYKIKKMKDLYEQVINEIKKYNMLHNQNFKIVFKIHPLDKNLNLKEFEIKEDVILTRVGDTKELIRNSELVIVINSTVGIEALMENKKVITLGEAFYNIEDLVENLEISKLSTTIEKILEKKYSSQLRKNFLWYLRFRYFKEIYYKNPCKSSLKKIVEEIKINLNIMEEKYEKKFEE